VTIRTGGCACGAIRFKIIAPLAGVSVCHCSDCQKASGGPPNYVALALTSAFEVTQGEAKLYVTTGDSGAECGRAFCPDCGTPLWSTATLAPDLTPIKLGALDDSSGLMPSAHVYTASAPPWHLMHDTVPMFLKMPSGAERERSS
jgi:hypothetical protein